MFRHLGSGSFTLGQFRQLYSMSGQVRSDYDILGQFRSVIAG